ncbi:MAG: glycosyltransferase family 4 protein [Candidatus Saccharimonadales bacterium]
MKQLSELKVAIVCDWLTGTGGAERVVLEMHRMFPKAPIYTSQYDSTSEIWYGDDWFQQADIRTLWLQNLPAGAKKFLPVFRALAFSKLDLSDYDLVLSSAGAEAKAVTFGAQTTHVAYIHAPTHYYWSRYDQYVDQPGFGALDPIARAGLKALVGPMRQWDYRAAQKPSYLLTNSSHSQAAIKQYYNRDASVIYPPVDTKRFKVNLNQTRRGFVVAGRQTPYKRIDLAVAACSQLNLPLTVIGNGPDHTKLVNLAGPSVRFVTSASDKDMANYFAEAEAFIFPGVDDFGITPVEAMAAGTPVIAFRDGGALDYVEPNITGDFFNKPTIESLVSVLRIFDPIRFDSRIIMNSVNRFDTSSFRYNFQKFLKELL